MPTIHLTKTVIDQLQAATRETVYWDAGLPAFGVKVTPKNRKVFIVLYRTTDGQARLRKYTIGPYGHFTLQQARAAARQVLAARSDGRDPATEKKTAKVRTAQGGIDELVADFIAKHASKNRTAMETERIFRREVLSRWGGRSVQRISKHDVIELIEEIERRGAPIMANRVLAAVRKFFNWLVGRALLDRSPCDGISALGREKARDRVLDDTELTAVLEATGVMGEPFGSIVGMLVLTGQRREEVAGLAWAEIDQRSRLWNLSGARTKNGKPHIVHLSDPAWALLDAVPRLGPLAFSTDGEHSFQNFGRSKKQLDAVSGVSGWVLHDLRRTVVSGMARLGVPPHIADKILNHQTGTISGVAAVYQRHEFLAETEGSTRSLGVACRRSNCPLTYGN
jgi:integrase